MKNCEKCAKEHDGSFGSGRFCSRKCSNSRPKTEESKNKLSEDTRRKFAEKTGKIFSKEEHEIFRKKRLIAIHQKAEREKNNILLSGEEIENILNLKITQKERNKLLKAAPKKTLTWDDLSLERKRERIIEEQENSCNKCGTNLWNGLPITLELEHKDGDRSNNSRSNLECLCPNCHSQTDTWRGRNKKTAKKVSDEDIIHALKTSKSIRQACLSVGLAGKGSNYNRIKKILESLNVKHIKELK